MPFDEPVESQNDAGALPRRFVFPLEDEDADEQNEPSIGQRIMQLVPTQVVPDEPRPLRGIDAQQRSDNKPQVEAKPSIGQRIVQMGRQGLPPFDIQDGRPVWRQDPQTLAKPNIGQRIMRMATPAKPQFEPLPRVAPAGMGVGNSSDEPDLFSSLVPGNTVGSGAIASGSSQNRQYQTSSNEPGKLGKSVAEAAGAMAGVGLGAVRALQTPVINSSHSPQTLRHLAPHEQEATAGVAYSETTSGSVDEHEAIASVILNRARSGQRQYVDPGQSVNVMNVIHGHIRHPGGRLGGYQFKGVGGRNERNFPQKHDAGSQNARAAAANVAQNGPTNHATAFIVTTKDKPRDEDVKALGNVHFVGQVGHVFLYEPGPERPAVNRDAKSPRPRPPQQPRQSMIPR